MAGLVFAEGRRVDKPGTWVGEQVELTVRGDDCPFVSRGGLKLAHALDHFRIEVQSRSCLDLGSSTGGFSHCLLLRGASGVHCVDVGRGLLHWKLRNDPRITLHEGYNARFLSAADFPGACFGIVVLDLAFISQRLVLPALYQLLREAGRPPVDVVSLVKPQFEAGRAEVGKGGIVRDEAVRRRTVDQVAACARELGFAVRGWVESPVTGADGNVEFLLHLQLLEEGGSHDQTAL